MVFTLVGLGAGALWRVRPGRAVASIGLRRGTPPSRTPSDASAGIGRTVPVGPAVVVVGLALLIGFNLLNQPPAVSSRRRLPGRRGRRGTGSSPRPARARRSRFARSPTSSRPRPMRIPLIRAGASVLADTGSGPVASSDGALVVICDSLFEESIGAPCGGPAEATSRPPTDSASRRPLPGRARPHDLGLSGRAGVHAVAIGAGNRERRRPRRRRSLPRDPDRGGRIRVVPWCVLSNAPVPGSMCVRPGAPC